MLRLLGRSIDAEGLTDDFSGGGALLRCAVARRVVGLLRRRRMAGGGASSSLGARCVLGEESERERAREWHGEEEGGSRVAYL